MFGPDMNRKYKPRGRGKSNLDYECFALRINPSSLTQIRNLSLRFGGLKYRASINGLINLLLSHSLETEEIILWLEQQFPSGQKRDFIQFTVRD